MEFEYTRLSIMNTVDRNIGSLDKDVPPGGRELLLADEHSECSPDAPAQRNKNCLLDGKPCVPAGDGGCMACDDGLGNYNQKHVDCDCMECRPWTT